MKLYLVFSAALLTLLVVAYIYDRLGVGKKAPAMPSVDQSLYFHSYHDFWQRVLYPCVEDCYQQCEISRPRKLEKHMPNFPFVSVDKQNRIVFLFVFERRADFLGYKKNEVHKQYSTLPLAEIVSELNKYLPNYSISAGFGCCRIVGARELSDGQLCVAITRCER